MTNIQDFLAKIAATEGENFVCDAETISEKSTQPPPSLAIKIVSIFGGLLGISFFLGFLGLAGFFETGLILPLGIMFLIGALVINRLDDNAIMDTLLVAALVAGFAMIAVGLIEDLKVSELITALIMLIIGFAVIAITEGYMLTFISTLLISGASFNLIFENMESNISIIFYNTVFAGLLRFWAMNEAEILNLKIPFIKNINKRYLPVLTGLIFTVLGNLFYQRFGNVWYSKIGEKQNIWEYFYAVPFIIAIFSVLPAILEKIEIRAIAPKILSFALTAVLLIFTLFSASVAGALLLILLCFYLNYRTGLILGIAAFLYFFGQFYYDLNVSLLTKSILMFVSGFFFLVSYYFINKFFANNQ